MKYMVFWTMLIAGVPAMAVAAASSSRVRGLLFAGLILSTALGDLVGINFVSMEHYRGPDRGFEITLTDLIAVALVAALIVRCPARLDWLPLNSLWMVLFFAISCIACWSAPQKLLAAFTLFKLVKVYLLYWCVTNCLHSGIDRIYLWTGYVTMAAVVVLLALKQKYVEGVYRISGPFDHSNSVPLYLNLVIPVLLAWVLTDRSLSRRQVLVSVSLVLGMMFAVTATFSRAGTLLAVLAPLAVLAVVRMREKSVRITAVSVLAIVAVIGGGLKVSDSLIERVRNAPESSADARREFNVVASQMAAEHLFGVGLNNFSYVFTNTPRYKDEVTVMTTEEQGGVAHHIYWLTAAELGFPGLIVFLIIMARFLWLAVSRGLRRRSVESTLLLGIAIGFCTLHASGFLEWAFRITPVTYMFAITAGVCAALVRRVELEPDRANLQRSLPRCPT